MKVAHFADTHIRNLNYQTEYKQIFKQIFDKLLEEKPDVIIHCGDLGHTKTQISPEYVYLASYFLTNLSKIARTLIIAGNHDGNLKNPNRMDAIEPLVKNINSPNLVYLKKSGEYPFQDNFVFNVLSIFDRDNWTQPTDKNKINIALYHGSINGCDTDIGWTMANGDSDISIFDNFDYALLGDIHKTNQILDDDGRVRYPGSTIQQNHGETNDKGFLIWEIENKESFSVRHISFENPKPFITISLNENGDVNEQLIPSNARLRLISEFNFPVDIIRKTMDVIRTKYKPDHLTFLDKSNRKSSVSDIIDEYQKEDLRSIEVQEKLIKEFLKDYKIDETILNKVYEINKKYNSIIEEKESTIRNVDFKLIDFKWNNLFNYGPNNSIRLEKLDGIVGIFGKNFSGKTSIIDGILYTLFNGITKKSKKSVNIVNLDSQTGDGQLTLQVGSNNFRIQRKSEKYVKKLHGKETIEAKTNVNFELFDPITGDVIECLNGIDRNETDRNISKYFGSIDDFLLTSMSSQLGSLSYIDKGSTERKENLAKFLDLNFFAEKFDLANEDASIIKSSLKRFDNRNFEEELKTIIKEIKTNEQTTSQNKVECEKIKENISSLEKDIFELDNLIKNSPIENIDIKSVLYDKENKQIEKNNLKKELDELKLILQEDKVKITKMDDFVQGFDFAALKEKEKQISLNEQKINSFIKEIEDINKTIKNDNSKIEILKHVPCGPEYSHCKFIKTAYEAKEELSIIDKVLQEKQSLKEKLDNELKQLEPVKNQERIDKFTSLLDKKRETNRKIEKNTILISKKESEILLFDVDLERLTKTEENYYKNKEQIEKLSFFVQDKNNKSKELRILKEQLEKCDKITLNLYKNNGSLEEKIKRINLEQDELKNLRSNYEAYDLFLKSMHSNGISYDIIKKSLPTINKEISQNLANIVDFEIFFQNEENRLELYIKRPNDTESLPIEMASASQKMLAAMAIRLAFIQISSLPKSDIFVLDEPGTALDEENMEGFIRMLDVIKAHFKSVILISHIDSLKDVADIIINIDKNGNNSHVSY